MDADAYPDANSELTPSAFTFVEVGTVNADTGWVMSSDGDIPYQNAANGAACNWTQFSSAGVITASNGAKKVTNDIQMDIESLTTDNATFAVGDKLAYMDSGDNNLSKSISLQQVLDNLAGAGLDRNGTTLDIVNATNGGILVDTDSIAMDIIDLDPVAIAHGDLLAFSDDSDANKVTKSASVKQLGDVYVSASSHLEIDNSSVITITADSVTNTELANMTQGTVKVGGTANAPTDLDASNDGYMLIGDGS